jgi:glycosyltransferase involved in cell wall biosynthesis
MKILYTVHQFLPDFFSGTEILTYDTAKEMVKRGHEVCIFTGHLGKQEKGPSSATDAYEVNGLPVYRFFYAPDAPDIAQNPIRSEYDNPAALDFFKETVSRIKPDIVHFYHLQRMSAEMIDICASLNLPMVYFATDFWAMCPKQQLFLPDYSFCEGPNDLCVNCLRHFLADSRFKVINSVVKRIPDRMLRYLVRHLAEHNQPTWSKAEQVRALVKRDGFLKKRFKKIDKILVSTSFMAEAFKKWGMEGSKLGCLAFGIDDCSIGPTSEKGNQAGLRIGFIGSLFDHKGAHVLIEAIRRLPDNLPVEVSLYGDMTQFPGYAKRLVKLAGDDPRIRFKGTFRPERISQVFSSMDLLTVPSLWHENTPLVIYSAQQSKVPIIGSNVSGISEIVSDGVNGLLFERGNSAALAFIIETLCNDRARVKALSRNARVPNSLSAYADRLEAVYMQIKK